MSDINSIAEEKVWAVYSNDNNNGKGGWDYHYPVLETDEDLDYWFRQHQYNSMVGCKCFKSFEAALAYHDEMNR